MARLTRHRGIMAVVLAVATVTVLVTGVRAEVSVTGDTAAYAEIEAAYKNLLALPGFRIKMAGGPGGADATGEVTPPDSMHMLMKLPSGEVEMIRVGKEVRFRTNAPEGEGKWQCVTGAPAFSMSSDDLARELKGTVEIAVGRGADTTIGRESVHTYTVTAKGSGLPTTTETLYVGVESGLPRRAVVPTIASELTIDYYDYGVKLDITLPSCE